MKDFLEAASLKSYFYEKLENHYSTVPLIERFIQIRRERRNNFIAPMMKKFESERVQMYE